MSDVLAVLVRHDAPATWEGFSEFCAARSSSAAEEAVLVAQDESSAARVASIVDMWPSEGREDAAISMTFSNDSVLESGEVIQRPPVTLPILCVAVRLGDALVAEALMRKLPSEEIVNALLQDVADNVDTNVLSRCATAGDTVTPDQRAFLVISAVEDGRNRSLPGVLRWADAVGALQVLCNEPSLFGADVWHLAVFEHALRLAVDASALQALEVLLYTLPKLPLLHSQRQRVLMYIFEQNAESCLNIFLHRFPDLTKDVDRMHFNGQEAESLRRRCLYRLYFEPAATAALHGPRPIKELVEPEPEIGGVDGEESAGDAQPPPEDS